MDDIEKEFEETNNLMHSFIDNRNKLGLVYNEFVNRLGNEYYLSQLSNTFLNAFNTFERFYGMVDDKLKFANMLNDISLATLDFFKIKTNEDLGRITLFKKKKILDKELAANQEKLNNLLSKLDEINDYITKSCEKYAKTEG